jgi:hypothetical protein
MAAEVVHNNRGGTQQSTFNSLQWTMMMTTHYNTTIMILFYFLINIPLSTISPKRRTFTSPWSHHLSLLSSNVAACFWLVVVCVFVEWRLSNAIAGYILIIISLPILQRWRGVGTKIPQLLPQLQTPEQNDGASPIDALMPASSSTEGLQ